jgi:hypothetical protein
MTRWRGAIGTALLLLLVIGAIGVRATPPSEQASPQPTASASASALLGATAGNFTSFHSATAGFDVRLPRGWVAADHGELVNRWSVRLLVIGNRSAGVPDASGSPVPGRTPDWTRLASDQIVLELLMFGGPGGPSAGTETSFPLDWSDARPMPDGQGTVATTLSVSFQHLLRPLSLVARIGTSAAPSDVAEITGIVASLAPEPIPTGGEYRGWQVVGPLASFPVGTVQRFGSSTPRAYGFYLVRGAKTVFAFIESAYLSMLAMKPCPIRYEAASRTFVCDATGERWSRVGRQLTEPGHFGLGYHTTFVKDGLVLVGGGSSGSSRNTNDEAAEFSDPIAPAAATLMLTKSDILDRYSRLTSTTPTVRAAAKLVPSDVATRSQVVRGSYIPAETRTVWIVAFAGDVRMPGSAETQGRWSLFMADPHTGGVITATCCGEGDWPPGFDLLPDLAGS